TWRPRWRCNRPTAGPAGSSPHKSDAAKGDEMKDRRHALQGDWRVAAVVLWLWASCSSASDAIKVKPGQAQLFLDDFVIEKMEGLKRTMHQPAKRGAVIRSRQPGKTLQTRSAPAWDPGKRLYSLWVLGVDDTFWQSKDGLHWAPGGRPNLRTDLAVHDPVDRDPARRFKAALTNEGFAASPDGINWTRLGVPKVP